jgi:hypothetical protein
MSEPKCPYWTELETMNGWECYCQLGAYGQTVLKEDLQAIGCTRQKREHCLQIMINRQGYGLVPTEISFFPKQQETPEAADEPMRKAK